MKTWNIVFKSDPNERFILKCPSGEKKFVITDGKTDRIEPLFSTNIFQILSNSDLCPTSVVKDLLHIALTVYTVDQIISRGLYGFQGWSRHLKLHIPVKLLAEWNNVKLDLEELLSFLSGDKWELSFRNLLEKTGKGENKPLKDIDNVALFSGGLDSFISAIDLMEAGKKICFVSHYKRGSESPIQKGLYEKLIKKYGNSRIINHQIYVQPNLRHKGVSKEDSSRSRSFLFLCLGLTFANCLGETIELIVPENGLISLNVPLTGTRLGSHSTRTTHPFYVKKFEQVIRSVGIRNPIINPYQFHTKGEMMVLCKNKEFLESTYKESMSCSHPDQSRYSGYKPGSHCGYCVPCIIRQAAEFKSKISKTKYVKSIMSSGLGARSKSGRDLRAFRLSIERLKNSPRHSVMFDLLSVGPLPFSKVQLDKYIDTYLRGMEEVRIFLTKA